MSVLITGAAAGLGRALAQAYLDLGKPVLAVDCDPPDLGTPLTLDLLDPGAAQTLVDTAPNPIELIIHSAGISATGPFEDIPPNAHARVIDLNFKVPIKLTQALLASGKADTARHVFIGSLSTFTGYPGATSYAASKDGLASFARSLHAAGHASSCVFPGPLRTDHAARYAPDNSQAALSARQSTDDAAQKILRALDRGQRTVFPGFKARAFALAGRLAPRMTGRALRRGLYDKMDRVRL